MSTEIVVRTACPAHCANNACGILAHVRDGRVVKLEPAPFPDNRYTRICQKGLATLQILYHRDRLRYPLRKVGARGEGKWQRLSWDEALDYITERLKEVADKYGSRSVAWVLGGPGSGTTKFGAYTRLAGCFQGTRVSTWGYGDAAGQSRPGFGVVISNPLWDQVKVYLDWSFRYSFPAVESTIR